MRPFVCSCAKLSMFDTLDARLYITNLTQGKPRFCAVVSVRHAVTGTIMKSFSVISSQICRMLKFPITSVESQMQRMLSVQNCLQECPTNSCMSSKEIKTRAS